MPQPGEAFQVSARASGPGTVRLTWDISAATYLYRDKFELAVVRPEGPRWSPPKAYEGGHCAS
ncbi:protein-disulfide reductase DsbD domain-containing protein [Thiohalorhabdus methylotrophus]|uniref:Protein-disulfide reductase DsbD domain-containing protein n=1 Tax=Thiohalorhabdus methylotrophus TaxID=3242694 RepID=A0ABV4TRH3_9GAMM